MKELKFNHLLQNLKTDKQAVKEIYEEYYPKIIIHLSRRFGKLISPVDIAHDTFLALMSAEKFSYVEYPTTWLYTMADNKAIDALKHKNKETTLPENFSVPFQLDELVLKEDVKKSLRNLDEESQMIIYLHIWEGYSHKEIADFLHLSYANVRTKASRAYDALKNYL